MDYTHKLHLGCSVRVIYFAELLHFLSLRFRCFTDSSMFSTPVDISELFIMYIYLVYLSCKIVFEAKTQQNKYKRLMAFFSIIIYSHEMFYTFVSYNCLKFSNIDSNCIGFCSLFKISHQQPCDIAIPVVFNQYHRFVF